jgi:hypothetical protein
VFPKKLYQKKGLKRRWEDCIKDNVSKATGRKDWKKKVRDRPEWNRIVKKTSLKNQNSHKR